MKSFFHEVSWYGIASICALCVDAGTLWILVKFFAFSYVAAATLSFLAGATVAYAMSIRLVFRYHRVRDRRAEFISFVAIGAPGLALNATVISVAVEYLGLHFMLAKCVAAGATFGYNFSARRQLLFRQRPPENQGKGLCKSEKIELR